MKRYATNERFLGSLDHMTAKAIQKLSEDGKVWFDKKYHKRRLRLWLDLLLWLIGCHYFYEGSVGKGLIYLATGGFFLIGIPISGILSYWRVKEINHQRVQEILAQVKALSD